MSEQFCVIYCSEDGIVSFQMVNKEELLRRIHEKYYGNSPFVQLREGQRVIDAGERVGTYIIKGESVIPLAKHVVTEWEI